MKEGRISVKLTIEGKEKAVRGIRDALEPDNREVPEGVLLNTEILEGKYIVIIEGPVSKISTILNIADEILELAKTAERLIE